MTGLLISALGWATGGARWRVYLVGAAVSVAILGAVLWAWSASIRRDERARQAALATAEALARTMERAATDDQIREMGPAQRKRLLRERWAEKPGGER